jgi:hypothetical protein
VKHGSGTFSFPHEVDIPVAAFVWFCVVLLTLRFRQCRISNEVNNHQHNKPLKQASLSLCEQTAPPLTFTLIFSPRTALFIANTHFIS